MVVLSKDAGMLSDFVQSKEYNDFKTIPSRVHNWKDKRLGWNAALYAGYTFETTILWEYVF